MSISVIIIIVTCIVSILSFPSSQPVIGSGYEAIKRFDKLKFNARAVIGNREFYRLLSSGFVHADWFHLIFNMVTLYCFGPLVEKVFCEISGNTAGRYIYLLLYVSAIAVSSLPDLIKHKNDSWFNAVGASGAISAVLFSSILFFPTNKIFFFFIPVGIPAFIFAPLYLLYCLYMGKKNIDNIGHTAHFAGAIYGMIFTLIESPLLINAFLNFFA